MSVTLVGVMLGVTPGKGGELGTWEACLILVVGLFGEMWCSLEDVGCNDMVG